MGLVWRRKVISTDASNTGCGALCEGRPTYGSCSSTEKRLHINCLEIMAVYLGLKPFLPHLIGHQVLVQSDNMAVVSYINHHGGLRSSLYRLDERLHLWAQWAD